jgi:branched-chain amino acid transport system ATP-binding protein
MSASTTYFDAILTARGLGRSFRGLHALSDYELALHQGEILGVIGPNGAGKTTLFNVISGFLPPSRGLVQLDGDDITGLPADTITRLGIARTFQNIRLFPTMTALENVRTAQQMRSNVRLVDILLNLPGFQRKERAQERMARGHLASLGLESFADAPAVSLPYGFQRKLEIARALATEPRILLLDEPAAGMNPNETAELVEFIREIHDRFDLTIIVVEHDMSLIMPLCDRIQVLNYGRVIAEGTPEEIRTNADVIEAYLGTELEGEA